MNPGDPSRAIVPPPEPPVPPELGIGRGSRAELDQQLEDLLDAVWRAEREWALDDRIDLGWRLQQHAGRVRGVL